MRRKKNEVTVRNGVGVVHLAGGKTALVDAKMVEHLGEYSWVYTHGYCVIRTGGKSVYLHRHILLCAGVGIPEGMNVDHINGDGCDNRLENLRVVTRSQNQCNRISPNDGVRGVSWCKERQKWAASIKRSGRKKFLGRFDTKEEAALAYNAAAESVGGVFRLNPIGA